MKNKLLTSTLLASGLSLFSAQNHAVTMEEPVVLAKDFVINVEKESSVNVDVPTESVMLDWQELLNASMTSMPFVYFGHMDIETSSSNCAVTIETANQFTLVDGRSGNQIADYSVSYTTIGPMYPNDPVLEMDGNNPVAADLPSNAHQLVFGKDRTPTQYTSCDFATLGMAVQTPDESVSEGHYTDVIRVTVVVES